MEHNVQNFATQVIERSHQIPVLVDFWAEWCAPCRMLSPILERLAEKYTDQWELAKVDTEQFGEIAQQYGVQGIPNVKLFVDGQVVDEFVGVMPEEMIAQWLHKALPSKYRGQMQKARQLIQEGKLSKAQKVLQQVIDAEPTNHQATFMLAQSYLYDNPQKALDLIATITPDSEYFDAAESVRTFGELFILSEHPEKLPEDPAKEPYLAAIKHLRIAQFEEALQEFISIIRKNRYYHDDGSRKACIAIFTILGADHELTRTYRPEFSSALYA